MDILPSSMVLLFRSNAFQFIPSTFSFVIRPNFTDSPEFSVFVAVNTISLPSEFFPPPHPGSDLNYSNVTSPLAHILTVFILDALSFSSSTIIVFS